MGRKRNSFVRDFFTFDKTANISVCKACSDKFSGENVTNMKRHMVTNHFEIYNEEKDRAEADCDATESKKIKFNVEVSKSEVSNACIDFATKQALPFSFFDSNAFKVFSKPIFDGLKMDPVTSSNITELINQRYSKIKDEIIKISKNRMVSIKMDSATRFDRSVLGINMQIIENSKILCWTLSVKELHCRQTSENLKKELQSVLNDFGISLNQVYSITTDNGRNMIKTVSLLNDFAEEEGEDEELANDESENLLPNECGLSISSVKCAAHTVQLAVKDFVETKEPIIFRGRQVVKTLRTPSFRQTLLMLNLGRPIMDVPTRWNSTYSMLERLLRYKDMCIESLKDPLSSTDWESIEELVQTLLPAFKFTLQLQQEQLLMGDFYKSWLTLKVVLQEKSRSSAMAAFLLQCLEKREPELMENDCLKSALFLDPRLRRTLSSEQKETCKQHLKKLAQQMIGLNQPTVPQGSDSPELFSSNPEFLIDESTNQSTTSLLRQSLRPLEVDSEEEEEGESVLKQVLAAFAEIDTYKPRRADIETDLLKYWEDNKYCKPILRKLAHIVHAVPVTQVSVERLFSALKLILSDKRCNLSEESLKTTLFVKLNNSSF